MTKQRPPLSDNLALTTVAGRIGWRKAAQIVGRAERTIRNWSDPDTGQRISFGAAVRLDRAYEEAGGEGYPFRDFYDLQLELDRRIARATEAECLERIAHFTEEAGQASSALIRAHLPGAQPADRILAQREAEEAQGALTAVLRDLNTSAGT